MRRLFKPLFFIFTAVYPVVVFVSLVILKIPVRIFSLFIVFFSLVSFIVATSAEKGRKNGQTGKMLFSSGILFCAGIACAVTDSSLFLRFYPVLINAVFLGCFAFTLVRPPSIIFRLATLQDKTIKGSLAEKKIGSYCVRVTLVWCFFFVFNCCAALYTVFFASETVWSVYNGGISYLLMGILFAGEFIIRKVVDKKMPKSVPFSQFTAKSHAPDMVMCYERRWSDNAVLTWKDFLSDTARMRCFIRAHEAESWILHCDDYWYFLVSFAALLQCRKKILLTANVSPAFIAEIRTDSAIRFLTDQDIPDTDFVPDVLRTAENPTAEEIQTAPEIIADETVIVMYTSGSTGHPKKVQQRLTEFELDNAFVLSKWGDEFLKRKLCATVSQHHIYGLLFAVLLPFTAGIPFRRKRIEYPEEFELLTDDSYMIIAVPAFLKRSVAVETKESLHLDSCWIFTSGGVLTPDTAQATAEVFGFWPVEVYGSTETSGIAYRQSKNGLEWTPFDNAQIWKNEEGCLVIKSPYIKDPAGFTTGDLVEIYDDGRFLLKGRADSIVKIEEKRISVTEVESRILQSGLVADVCVVPMSDRRQYLAAALVLNDAGKEKFGTAEKYTVNRFFHDYLLQFFENVVLPKKWRYLEALPMDVQGKKKKPEIQALFSAENLHGIPAEQVIEKTESSVDLELFIPASSDYFDGHFPDFKLLPAVAQIELVVRFSQRYFKTPLYIPDIRRCKFTRPLKPDTLVHMHLSYADDTKTVSFKIANADNSTVFASGSFVTEAQA